MSNFKLRPDTFPPMVKNLIILNVLVFVAQLVFRSPFNLTDFISLYPILPKALQNVMGNDGAVGFKPYQIATHLFAHSPQMLFHIVFNMFALWMFGRILENVWGPQRFLFFYLACGIGAALCHLLIQYIRCEELLQAYLAKDNVLMAKYIDAATAPALGASGAIMGIFAAFGYLFPNTELFIMFIPFPIKAKWAVIGMAAYDLFGGVANLSGDNVAHFAHLGGAITGFIIVLIWNKGNRRRFY